MNKIKNIFIKNYILVLLAVFFVVHLFAINAPILDSHSWRQSDTLAVANNFLKESSNILYPRVDIRGQYSGITGMEFPAYNYLIFISYKLTHADFWQGRLITLLFSLLGLWFFYKLTKTRYGDRVSAWASFFLATSPLYFYFSRNIQPDVMMLALILGGLYYFQLYADKEKGRYLIAAVLFFAFASLVKLPAIFFLPGALVMLLEKKRTDKNTVLKCVLGLAIIGLPSLLWYRHSNFLSQHYGLGTYYYNGLELGAAKETLLTWGYWWHVYALRYFSSVTTVLAGLLSLLGLYVSIVKKHYFELVILASLIVFSLLFANKFLPHIYYSLPFSLVAAILAAFGIEMIQKKNLPK